MSNLTTPTGFVRPQSFAPTRPPRPALRRHALSPRVPRMCLPTSHRSAPPQDDANASPSTWTSASASPDPSPDDWPALWQDVWDASGTSRFAQGQMKDVQREWTRHRRSRRHIRHVLGLPKSQLLVRILPVCVFTGAESLLISLTTHALSITPPHLSQAPFALMSGVVGLLLVFRTNSSFQRFWEARKAWGDLVNRCRDGVRIAQDYVSAESETRLRRYVAAFPYVLRDHLRGLDAAAAGDAVAHLLEERELEVLRGAAHAPNVLALMMTSTIARDARMERNARMKMDDAVSSLIDVLGTSERILRTPIPLSYTRHTSRVCLVWCLSMPFVLYSDMGDMGCLVASVVTTFTLLGIEDIGVNIEEPFRILPLDQLCSTIERNVGELGHLRDDVRRAILAETETPAHGIH